MAPAASRLRAEPGIWALPRRALAWYLLLLRLYPVHTKAATRWAREGWAAWAPCHPCVSP